MSLATTVVPSPLRTDETGVIRIGSSRVPLEGIVHAFDAGASAEEIVPSYPTLDLGDVYATIAYILKNPHEIDAYLAQSEAEAERVHREWKRSIRRRSSGDGSTGASATSTSRPRAPRSPG